MYGSRMMTNPSNTAICWIRIEKCENGCLARGPLVQRYPKCHCVISLKTVDQALQCNWTERVVSQSFSMEKSQQVGNQTRALSMKCISCCWLRLQVQMYVCRRPLTLYSIDNVDDIADYTRSPKIPLIRRLSLMNLLYGRWWLLSCQISSRHLK